jgi:hypothetical protein
MATTVNVSSNYAGKEAGKIIGASFREADTLRLGLVSISENINYKLNMRKIAYTDGTTDYSCGDFTPSGAITLSERVLEPKKLMNPIQVCKEDFRATWSEDLEGASASNPNLASDIQDAIIAEVLADTAERTDNIIWVGDGSVAGEFDGFITLFDADGNVIKANNGIIPIGAAITEANVESELKKVLNAVPVRLRRKSLSVAVSPDVFQAYNFYLVSKGIANGMGGEDKQVKFGKYNLTEVNGLPDNTIVVFEKTNLLFGTGLLADHNELRMVDEDEIGLLTGLVRGKMVYNAGVQYYNSEDVVYYLSTTTPA